MYIDKPQDHNLRQTQKTLLEHFLGTSRTNLSESENHFSVNRLRKNLGSKKSFQKKKRVFLKKKVTSNLFFFEHRNFSEVSKWRLRTSFENTSKDFLHTQNPFKKRLLKKQKRHGEMIFPKRPSFFRFVSKFAFKFVFAWSKWQFTDRFQFSRFFSKHV